MSEETVDIHIRLSADGAKMLQDLMGVASLTSKSAYIEEMIFAIENIMASFWTYYHVSAKAQTEHDKLLIWQMFNQYLLAVLRRLGWPNFRDYFDEQEKQKKRK